MVMASSVLFTRMGLADEIQRRLGIDAKILSCPKCCTFWGCAVLLLAGRAKPLPAITASFISAYVAQWLALAYDQAAVLYNRLYEKITENPGTEGPGPEAGPGSGPDGIPADSEDAVP